MSSNDRGSFSPHVPCNCERCALLHGDQAYSESDRLIDHQRQQIAALREEVESMRLDRAEAWSRESEAETDRAITAEALKLVCAERDGAIAEAAAAKREPARAHSVLGTVAEVLRTPHPNITDTKHTYRCDGCGKAKTLDHGKWAEPALPKGWRMAMGYPIHACSATCENRIQTKKQKTDDPRPWLFVKPTVEAA